MTFDEWWDDQVGESHTWTILERIAARDAWNAAKLDWQPIETAPDDRPIFIYKKGSKSLLNAHVAIKVRHAETGHVAFCIGDLGNGGRIILDEDVATHWAEIKNLPEEK